LKHKAGLFSTTFHWNKRTLVPSGISRESAIACFRNNDFLIHSDPDLIEYKVDTAPWKEADKLPADKTIKYSMTVNAQILPKAISSGSAVGYRTWLSELENGVSWGVTTSFGMNQAATWTVEPATAADMKEAGEQGTHEGRFACVQDVNIVASRLVMPPVKSRVVDGWKEAHERFHVKMKAIQAGEI
jgi:hypothetical protein